MRRLLLLLGLVGRASAQPVSVRFETFRHDAGDETTLSSDIVTLVHGSRFGAPVVRRPPSTSP